MRVVREEEINVHYDNEVVGEYFADLVAEGKVIVETQAKRELLDEHEAQLLNYLKSACYSTSVQSRRSNAKPTTAAAKGICRG